jgi:transposase-like protein
MIAADSLYKGFRFPEEIISHAVWLYYRFLLSLRDVQELLLERGIVVSHETIRAWCDGSDTTTPAGCAAAGPAPATAGTSMKCL